ncbi:hypothetical protein SEA_CHASER_129 [Mycobacterium phage Chaser]|nr:hypothetical protein SEA_CHASER_129 [Mycobacterium phage Chaser]
MEPTVRQICIADDATWDNVKRMFLARGIDLKRMPQFGDEEGIENYCLSPRGIYKPQ